jgi:NADH-quinone oxidoreductase subunit L
MLFVGWEGVGLCSFLLIGFWFDSVANSNAARKAFVANRVGDLAMILAMTITFWTFGSLEFEGVFESAAELFAEGHMVTFGMTGLEIPLGTVLTAVTALFLMGAAGKSAQIPLMIWLPDAMAGPTPVSALIHAATMVTSGIYLIVRSSALFEIVRESGAVLPLINISSPDLVAYIGAGTALYAGLIAFTQFDIKKVLAYSTVSQLGFMIAAAGMGAYVAAMFHLVTHAFFKALLFLSSGSVIHGMAHGHHELHAHHDHDEHHDEHESADDFDPQDMRTMGGLHKHMRTTSIVFHIGALALAGIVPLAGFWSKDEILAFGNENNAIVYWVLVVAAICTAFYMGRQLKMVFWGQERHEAAEHAHESPPLMTVPLMVLAVLSVVGGALNLPFFSHAAYVAAGEHPEGIFLILEGWLEHSLNAFHLAEEGILAHLPHLEPVLHLDVALLSTILALLALGGSFFLVYGRRPQTAEEKDPLQQAGGPVWRFFAALPINTLSMSYLVPAFNRVSHFAGITLDWRFFHDYFHNNIIRDGFVGISRITNNILDIGLIDGLLVNGSARFTGWLADRIRTTQSGYVRNYVLTVFLGVLALLAYFVLVN